MRAPPKIFAGANMVLVSARRTPEKAVELTLPHGHGPHVYFYVKGFWGDAFIPCSAEGYPSPWPRLGFDPAFKRFDYFQLVGQFVGPDGSCGQPIAVLNGKPHHVPEGATAIRLCVNDRLGLYWNNWGKLSVVATSSPIPDQPTPGLLGLLSLLVANTHGIPLIAGLIAFTALFLIGLPQGRDVMLSVIEDPSKSLLIAFYLTCTLLGLEAWFWARTIVNSNFGKDDKHWPDQLKGVLSWTPRLLGAAPFWAAAVSIALGPILNLGQIAGAFLGGLLLIFGFEIRRRWIRSPKASPRRRRISDATGAVVAFLSVVTGCGLLAGSWFLPPTWCERLGPAGIVFFAVALMIPLIAGLANLVRVTRIPITAALILAAFLFSQWHWSDNHDLGGRRIRIAERPLGVTAAAPIELNQAVRVWLERQGFDPPAVKDDGAPPDLTGLKPIPMVFVASEGGASRAGYWAALMLSQLETLSRDSTHPGESFSQHLFAISTISGGSVGAVGYVAAVHDRPDAPDPNKGVVTTFAGGDYLTPTLGGMLFPDLVQRVIPFPILPDRAESLERAWEIGWKRACDASGCNDPKLMEAPLRSLWSDLGSAKQTRWTPLLFINGTREDDGRRIIAAPIAINPAHSKGSPIPPDPFPDAVDLYAIRTQDIRLSTAILNTARFPIVSPGGVLWSDKGDQKGKALGRIIDGGYADGIGVATLIDLVRAVEHSEAAKALAKTGYRIEPVVVELNNDDSNWNPSLWRASQTGPYPPKDGDRAKALAASSTWWTLDDLLGPLIGLFQARGAKGTLAAQEISAGAPEAWGLHYVFLHLYPLEHRQLPMNWMASQPAQMRAQVVAGLGTWNGDHDPCGVTAQLKALTTALHRENWSATWTTPTFSTPHTEACNQAGAR